MATGAQALFELIQTRNTELVELLRLDERRVVVFRRRENLAVAGDPVRRAFFIRSGWAGSYWRLADGKRQVLRFLLKGDIVGFHPLLANVAERRLNTNLTPLRAGSTVTALTQVEAVVIDSALVEALAGRFPNFCGSLAGRIAAGDTDLLARRLATIGKGSARERMAVLWLELWQRQRAIGLADDRGFPLPLNQTTLADALGVTAVHVSRTRTWFEEEGILAPAHLAPRRIWVRDADRLYAVAANFVTKPRVLVRAQYSL